MKWLGIRIDVSEEEESGVLEPGKGKPLGG